jgi:mycofactocin precursor
MPESPAELLDPPTDEMADGEPEDAVAADLLVEEISIDGMCGVY